MNAVINDALNLFQIGVVLPFVVEIFQGHAVHLLCSSEPRTTQLESLCNPQRARAGVRVLLLRCWGV
jgi:hypothetical protein